MSVGPDETASTLFERISAAHVELMKDQVPSLLSGTAPRLLQDPSRASSWPKRVPSDGIIDWTTRAPYLYDWVRAQTRPYPGAFTFLGDTRIVVWRATSASIDPQSPAGMVIEGRENGVLVACGDGALVLEEVELQGGDVLEGAIIERAIPAGARLG